MTQISAPVSIRAVQPGIAVSPSTNRLIGIFSWVSRPSVLFRTRILGWRIEVRIYVHNPHTPSCWTRRVTISTSNSRNTCDKGLGWGNGWPLLDLWPVLPFFPLAPGCFSDCVRHFYRCFGMVCVLDVWIPGTAVLILILLMGWWLCPSFLEWHRISNRCFKAGHSLAKEPIPRRVFWISVVMLANRHIGCL